MFGYPTEVMRPDGARVICWFVDDCLGMLDLHPGYHTVPHKAAISGRLHQRSKRNRIQSDTYSGRCFL